MPQWCLHLPTTTRPARWVTRGHTGLGGVIVILFRGLIVNSVYSFVVLVLTLSTVSWSYCQLCLQFRGLIVNFVYSFVVFYCQLWLHFRGLRTCNISRPRLARRCNFHTTMGPQPHRDAFAKQLSRFNLATLTARADIQWSNSTHCYHDAKSRKTVHRAFSSFSGGLVVCRVLWRYW